MSNDFEKWVRGYVDELQDVDTAATELLQKVTLDAATGVQLDGLGQIIGAERQGLDDEPYRSLLRAYVGVNTSGGTIEEMIEIARLASNTSVADRAIELYEGSPAEFMIICTQVLPAGTGGVVAEAIWQGKAAGVHAVLLYHETEPMFAFDGEGGSTFDGGYYLRGASRNRGARESELL